VQSGFAADLSPAFPPPAPYTWSTYTRKSQHLYHTMDRVHPPHVPCVSTYPLPRFLPHPPTNRRESRSGNAPNHPPIHGDGRRAAAGGGGGGRVRRDARARGLDQEGGWGENFVHTALGSSRRLARSLCAASFRVAFLFLPRSRFDSVEFRDVGVGFTGVG
jgi:hypothetical protein